MPIRNALKDGISRLNAASVPSSALAAELLVLHILGHDRTWLYTHSDEEIAPADAEQYFALIARRGAGEPTQYILGRQEFWGLEFEVTPAVLIPRPETEHLIEVALERLGFARKTDKLRIADVGTGSGCIAITLAKEFPNAQILGTDISSAALEVAKRNANHHSVADRIHFSETDLLGLDFHPLPLTTHYSRFFDLIASNPPYIANSDAATLQREIREHEPEIALFGGPTGVEIYARLIEQAESQLAPGGVLVLELGYGAAERVREMIDKRRAWTNITITNDLAGIPRVLAAVFTGSDNSPEPSTDPKPKISSF
jgi:release factor glutamine methyltransferase